MKEAVLQLSNDAFFYILSGEQPIDETNLDEANEILDMFPNGFYIKSWEPIDNSDLIQAVFVTEDNESEWLCYNITKYIQIQIKWLDSTHIIQREINSQANTMSEAKEFSVLTNKYGLQYYINQFGSTIFINRFTKLE